MTGRFVFFVYLSFGAGREGAVSMILPVAIVFAAILFFGVLWLWYRKMQHSIWHYHDDRWRMRRWRNGEWEFRKMTKQEEKEELG